MSKVQSAKEVETGTHVQLIVYRVPKKNHDRVVQLQNQLSGIFRKHGILRSEFFQLSSTETFQGFTGIDKTVSANQDEEEVWMELESYKDRKHRDEVVAKITEDASAGPLFGQVMSLLTQGYSCIMGEFKRLQV
jgi:uncharacterized protein YbaA (DUF1428 family)